MKQTRIFNYFAFGNNYNVLRMLTPGTRMRGTGGSLESLVKGFLAACGELDLRVTRQASAPLVRALGLAQQAGEADVVPQDLSERVRKACADIDVTLDSELKLRHAFVVTPKRLGIEQLLEDPASLIGAETYARLPDICKFDLTEACKCIAFERPTAAVFHAMRAVEGMLRAYYCSKVKRNRVKRQLWNDMIVHLEKRKKRPPQPILDHLDNIRRNFRNPTQHPDAMHDMNEAQNLMLISMEAMNRMVGDMDSEATV